MYQVAYTEHHPAGSPISEALMHGGFIVQQRECPVRCTEIGSMDLLLAVSGGLYPRANPHLASLHTLGAVRSLARAEFGIFASARRTPEAVMAAVHERFCASMHTSHPELKAGTTLATLHLRRGKVTCLSVGDVRAYRCMPDGELGQLSRGHTFAQSMRDRGELQGDLVTDLRLHRAEHALFTDTEAGSPPAHRRTAVTSVGDTFALLSREAWVHLDGETLSQFLALPNLREAVQDLRDALLDCQGVGAFSILSARYRG